MIGLITSTLCTVERCIVACKQSCAGCDGIPHSGQKRDCSGYLRVCYLLIDILPWTVFRARSVCGGTAEIDACHLCMPLNNPLFNQVFCSVYPSCAECYVDFGLFATWQTCRGCDGDPVSGKKQDCMGYALFVFSWWLLVLSLLCVSVCGGETFSCEKAIAAAVNQTCGGGSGSGSGSESGIDSGSGALPTYVIIVIVLLVVSNAAVPIVVYIYMKRQRSLLGRSDSDSAMPMGTVKKITKNGAEHQLSAQGMALNCIDVRL